MKKTQNDYRGHSKKLETKNKTKAKAFAKKDAQRGKAGAKKEVQAEEAGRYVKPQSSGPSDKAYKLLAAQEGISNAKAKELIDRGLVYVGSKMGLIFSTCWTVNSVFSGRSPRAIMTFLLST